MPFVQRILNATYSYRLKLLAAELLFDKMLDLDSGLFVLKEERSLASPTDAISSHMMKLLATQDSILKIAVENSLFVDSLHVTSKTSDPFEFKPMSLKLFVLLLDLQIAIEEMMITIGGD